MHRYYGKQKFVLYLANILYTMVVFTYNLKKIWTGTGWYVQI